VAIVSFGSFADSSHAGIDERHLLCAQSHMHLAESAAIRPAAVGCSLQQILEAEIN